MSNPFDVFEGKVRGVILGKQRGDFRFENPGSQYLCTVAAREMGIEGVARASFYLYNTEEELEALAQAIEETKKTFGA